MSEPSPGQPSETNDEQVEGISEADLATLTEYLESHAHL